MGEWPIPEHQVVDHLLIYQEFRCFYCRESLWQPEQQRLVYHVEHMTPLARGGLHDWRNVCVACPGCNIRKKVRTSEEFTRAVG